MKKIITLLLLIVVIQVIQGQDSFEEYRQNQEAARQSYVDDQEALFASYHSEQDSLFIQYKETIEKLWNEFKESTPSEWVSYNEDFSSRSEVSFETGNLSVEAVVEDDSEASQEAAKEKVKLQLLQIMQEKDDTEKPVLAEQVKNPIKQQEPIKEEEIEEVVDQIVEQVTKTEITGSDQVKRVKYQIKLELVPDHIRKRAEKYTPLIEKYCKQYKISPKLALAIAHTESYFNPKAYNRHGNAYGMMQIVPKYAGLTMNNALYHKNEEPGSRDLFKPEINLEMGIGYLRWLADNKWDKVENKVNQEYCMICSYNGGPGTIYKAMTGKMRNIGSKWEPMFVDLSTMDSDRLYSKLCRDVPFEETRNYIQKVHKRMQEEYSGQ